jgi:leucyl aminopeptidase
MNVWNFNDLKITFTDYVKNIDRNSILAVIVDTEKYSIDDLTIYFRDINKKMSGMLSKLIDECLSDSDDNRKDHYSLYDAEKITGYKFLTIFFINKVVTKNPENHYSGTDFIRFSKFGAHVFDILNGHKLKEATICYACNSYHKDHLSEIMIGFVSCSYRFNKYLTKSLEQKKISLSAVYVIHNDNNFEYTVSLLESLFIVRDLANEPPNILYPKYYADFVKDKLSMVGVDVDIMSSKQIEEHGMRVLAGVAQGSMYEPQVVVMRWLGDANKNNKPLCFVGKGVTFDTGGLSIKPASYMRHMKYDMSGSAVVVGIMHHLAAIKAPINAIGIIGLVENSIDSQSQRPDDLIVHISGQSIEIDNTDAEGRLVLSDLLWFAQRDYDPKFIIDLATLTGAIKVTFGDVCAGLMSNDLELESALINAGNSVNERVCSLPMFDDYNDLLESDIADVVNSAPGVGAGSITAAKFLERFVNCKPWAHLDIASVSDSKKSKGIYPKGATGFGLLLLDRFVKNYIKNCQ